MWGGGYGSGGGGGLDASALAGYATQQWTEDNYVSKPFFNELFTIHGTETVEVTDGTTSEVTTTTTDITFAPNEVPSVTTETDETTGDVTVTTRVITSIEANYGLWTDYFISALGLNPSGGGGGGTTLNEPLASINNAGLATHPSSSGQTIVWDGTDWVYGNAGGGGGGGGTVTSVGLSMPTGFSVNNSPVTSLGVIAVSFASGYSLPTTAKQTNWDTAYSNSHSHSNKTVLDGITATDITAWDDAVTGLSLVDGRLQTVEGYFTNGVANSALRLSGTQSKTAWGQTYWQNGVPSSISGNMSSVGNITMSGKITMGSSSFVIEVDSNGDLKFNGNIYATGGVSALGQSSSGSSLVLNEPLSSINSSGLSAPGSSQNGQTIVWDNSAGKWKYGAAGGGGTMATLSWSGYSTGSYNGSSAASISIPNNTNQLTNGAGFITSSSVNGTFWGNNWSNGDSLSGSMTLNNAALIKFKDSGGTEKSALTMDSSNNLVLGDGFTASGYNTYVRGNIVVFQSGTSHTNAMQVQSDGTVYLPLSTKGLRIGDALLTWDSTNNALKISATNGTGAVNLYATGGISALGYSS